MMTNQMTSTFAMLPQLAYQVNVIFRFQPQRVAVVNASASAAKLRGANMKSKTMERFVQYRVKVVYATNPY